MTNIDRLAKLSEAGVSIWLDDLSRERLTSGNLATLIRDQHVTGVTTNPTIFAGALAHGAAYSEQVARLAARDASLDDTVRELTTTDVRNACDLFRATWEASGGVDGRVSIEVDPRLANDTEGTIAEALDLWKAVDRPNLLVKIPATVEGLPAVTKALSEGVSVNVTLIFSVERYKGVIDAFLSGLEQAKANGHELAGIASVASFFVSRVDTEVDKRLDRLGGQAAEQLRGQAAIANARLAYAAFEEAFGGPRWAPLADAGARPQRPLWASTGVKDPAYSDTRYVVGLVAPGTVNTMPAATLDALLDHGVVSGDTIRGRYAEAHRTTAELADAGIDLAKIAEELEADGVARFQDAWRSLLADVRAAL